MTTREYRVTGRVQGVGFRWWTARHARELGLAGTVRNETDGSVTVRVAGPEPSVQQLKLSLHHGPAAARVTDVAEAAWRPDPVPGSFTIVH